MKRTSRLLFLQMAAVVAIFSFGLSAYAETPRDELVHAYWLVKTADKDYAGHRKSALHWIEEAGKNMGLELKGGVSEKERQWKSDAQLQEAQRLLRDAREKLEEQDRKHGADQVERAINEIDKALNVR